MGYGDNSLSDLENFLELHLVENDSYASRGCLRMSRADARKFLTKYIQHWPEYAKALCDYEMGHNGVH